MLMTILEKTAKLPPIERIALLADEIDYLKSQVEVGLREQDVDSMIEVLELDELAQKYETTAISMKKKILQANGKVFKLGKKWVIRKISFLSVVEFLENV